MEKKTKIIFIIILFMKFNFQVANAKELSEYEKQQQAQNMKNIRELSELKHSDFNENNLRRYLILLNIPNVEIIINQARLESAWYTSGLFKNHNNIFGMHLAYKRETLSNGYVIADRGRKVSTYKTWQHSVEDFILYLKYWESQGYNFDNYLKFLLDVGYCEKGSEYIKILTLMLKS
jgi:uncharacterized FlgJ-related protein